MTAQCGSRDSMGAGGQGKTTKETLEPRMTKLFADRSNKGRKHTQKAKIS